MEMEVKVASAGMQTKREKIKSMLLQLEFSNHENHHKKGMEASLRTAQ